MDDHEEVLVSATFNDSEARKIASILGGMAYKPKALETVEFAFDDTIIEWYQVEPNAPAVNYAIPPNILAIFLASESLKVALTKTSS